jgi:NAD-dependent dihydropyrimidine dehydrogenase PreA subunit
MSANPTFWSAVAQHWEIARHLRSLRIDFDPDKCIGTWQCYEVCPVGCWMPDLESRVAKLDSEMCVACGACVLQCPEDAIELK